MKLKQRKKEKEKKEGRKEGKIERRNEGINLQEDKDCHIGLRPNISICYNQKKKYPKKSDLKKLKNKGLNKETLSTFNTEALE